MMGEAANEAIMVSGKSHLSLQAPEKTQQACSGYGEARNRVHIDCTGSRGRDAKMKDVKTHQPN